MRITHLLNFIKNKSNQNGQSFIEFILILLILVTLSFGFMRGFNYYVGVRWETMLKIIATPESSMVTIP